MSDEETEKQLDQLLSENNKITKNEAGQAKTIAEALEDEEHRNWYLGRLAKKMARANWLVEAREVVESITSYYERADADLAISQGFFDIGDSQVAEDSLQGIVNDTLRAESNSIWPWQKAEILDGVARLLIKMGKVEASLRVWERAVHIAQEGQTRDTDCSSILADISIELARVGRVDFAESVANSIAAPAKRTHALSAIGSFK